MSHGRPANIPRNEARAAGLKFYDDPDACLICGTNQRYTSNASCVECLIANGKAKWAALDEGAKLAQRERDQARYQRRKSVHVR